MSFECPECLESGSVTVEGSNAELTVEFCPFCGCVLDQARIDDVEYDDDDDNWTDEDEAELEEELADDED